MKTHNAQIYHCQSCGSVSHCECGASAPVCCGIEMVRAASETILEPNGNGLGRGQEELPHVKQAGSPAHQKAS